MKTGAICDIEYFMKNGCRGCKLSRLCEEKEKRDREKNDRDKSRQDKKLSDARVQTGRNSFQKKEYKDYQNEIRLQLLNYHE